MPRAASLLSASFAVAATAVAAFVVVGTGHATRDAVPSSHGLKPTLYVGQAAAGTGDGRSCTNAKALSFFNTASNWGAGKPIAPGTTVGLCGTVRSTLTFRGNGTSGNPITLLFESGAKISRPTCDCLDATNRSHVTIDGGSNGVIEATNNGVHRGTRNATRAIDMAGCQSCTVKNLTISNIFVMVPSGSDPIDHTQSNAVYFNGANVSIHDNTIHDVGWALYDNNGTNSRIYNNNIYNMDHGLTLSGGGKGPVFIHGNHFHDMGNWDCGGGCHHDGIHCYTVNGGTPNHYGNGIYIYDNRFGGTVGAANTSWLFLESRTGSGATPCADATSPVYVFNNYLTETDHHMNNGIATPASGKLYFYGNTIVGISSGNQGGYAFDCCAGHNGAGAFMNNVMSTVNNFGGWGTSLFSPIDYDVYGDASGAGSLRWYCDPGPATNTFSAFQAGCGEAHGSFRSGSLSLSAGVPRPGSPVLGAGKNLRPLCTGNLRPLCFDIRGALRPFRMRPDAGAFQRETAAIKSKAIGRVRLGSSRGAIQRFYGRRSTRRSGRQLLGFLRLRGTRTAAYRRHGGLFDVSYAGGKVAAVATTSRYYTTLQGFGVGAAAKLPGGGWRRCGEAFVRRRGGVATVVRLGGENIAAVAVARSAVVVCR